MTNLSSPMRIRLVPAIILALVVASVAPRAAALVTEPPEAVWRDALARSALEKKPLIVLFEVGACVSCREFHDVVLVHPAIARRLSGVVFVTIRAADGEVSERWASELSGIALFDSGGTLRARWLSVPGTTGFGVLLDAAVAVAPDFERALQLSASGAVAEAELAAADGLAKLGRTADARAALERAARQGSDATRQAAMVSAALLDARDGNDTAALARLREVVSDPATPELAADAWIVTGAIRLKRGARDEAEHAFSTAVALAPDESPQCAKALRALQDVEAEREAFSIIRILPPSRGVVTGRQSVRTRVSSPSVARVSFALDGREVANAAVPPFAATIDFGAVPQRRAILAVASDRNGKELGRDESIVNDAGETFWLKLVAPREGAAEGSVHVEANLRVPQTRSARRVTVTWNDGERAVMRAAPWSCTIDVPSGQVGILRAVAELDDGSTAEDAVLLNATGVVEHANVQLAELPLTVIGRSGSIPKLLADQITVREGTKLRRVESLATASETRLTVGLLLDTSESMQRTLPDLQEAAVRFLDSVLGERDRAFLITFDTEARLRQPATEDRGLLRREIMRLRPGGLTALHDAMALGLLQFDGVRGRRALIIFSDGLDITSRYSARDVSALAKRVNVPVHVIASIPGVAAASRGSVAGVGENRELAQLARLTGGTSHTLVDLAELDAAYSRIETALRAQILAFVRTDPATTENDWRSVRVDVGVAGVEVLAPEGYCATW